MSKQSNTLIGASQEKCIYCEGRHIVKKGRRKKKHETVQLWHCKDCAKIFTPQRTKGKTYPLRVVLQGLSLYYQGWSREEAQKLLKERYGLLVPSRTFNDWLKQFKEFSPYSRMRAVGKKYFSPQQLIRAVTLYHRQVYRFKIHQAKLKLTLQRKQHKSFKPIKRFLESMVTDCPHNLFSQGMRASDIKAKFSREEVWFREKQNAATRTANLVLQAVIRNTMRHEELQSFMLANDSVTVATEVPIYLLPEDIKHMEQELGFDIPLKINSVLTGHVDALQIRNGAIHILDFKPDAARVKPIEQLTLYALALSRRTGLRIYDFKCAWFDEKHYFEFFPLHVVYKMGHKSKTNKTKLQPRYVSIEN